MLYIYYISPSTNLKVFLIDFQDQESIVQLDFCASFITVDWDT